MQDTAMTGCLIASLNLAEGTKLTTNMLNILSNESNENSYSIGFNYTTTSALTLCPQPGAKFYFIDLT
jgi:hypothetical protein